MGKKISIVFEEGESNADGVDFKVYLEGISPHRTAEINRMSPEEQKHELSTAEFWALAGFREVAALMQTVGILKDTYRRS